MRSTVGVCGYSGTGSTAVVDLLKEYPQNQVVDRCEFTLPYDPDGLMDLDWHLHAGMGKFESSNTAVWRFRRAVRGGRFRYLRELTGGRLVPLADEYLDRVVTCSWVGSDPPGMCEQPVRDACTRLVRKLHLGGLYYRLDKRAGREARLFPMGTMWFSSHPEGFLEATREFTRGVVDAVEPHDPGRVTVLDQPFPGANPQSCFGYFDDPRAIVVDRDPRDLYLLCREMWFKSAAWRAVPVRPVEQFVAYWRGIRRCEASDDPSRVLRVRFEDLVYRYEETRKRIECFLGLPADPAPRTCFDPARSVNNTQLFKLYSGYDAELAYIADELADELYPFEEFGEVGFDRSEMFE